MLDKPSNHELFISKAKTIHGNRYQYHLIDSTNYNNIRSKLPIVCEAHGVFYQRGDDHNRGRGCPSCANKSASRKQLIWLDNIALQTGNVIQHAGNGGEYRVPGTNYSVDGFCASTNTVYEFEGDAFHGNPNRYKPDERCHPFDKSVTASQLYQATVRKHRVLEKQGYTVVSIWESEFDQLEMKALNEYQNIDVKRTDQSYPAKLLDCGLEIQGEYTGSKDKHTMRCLCCDRMIVATPIAKIQTLQRRPNVYGCPACNRTRVAEDSRKRGNYNERLQLLGYDVVNYTNASTRCVLQCKKCGKRHNILPSSVIQHNTKCCN